MPLVDYSSKNGMIISEKKFPKEDDIFYPKANISRITKRLPHRGIYECDVVFAPVPVDLERTEYSEPVRYAVVFMAVDTDEDGKFFITDMFDGYCENYGLIAKTVVKDFKKNGFLPEEMRVLDERTRLLLEDFCINNNIKLTVVDKFEALEGIRSYILNSILDETSDELEDKKSAVEMYEETCNTIRQLSEEQLAAMPKEIFEQFMEADILPKELQDKLRRSRIKF